MKRKLPTFLVKYSLLANGEEYPHEILIDAPTHSEAQMKLCSDVSLVGECEVRLIETTRFYYPHES